MILVILYIVMAVVSAVGSWFGYGSAIFPLGFLILGMVHLEGIHTRRVIRQHTGL